MSYVERGRKARDQMRGLAASSSSETKFRGGVSRGLQARVWQTYVAGLEYIQILYILRLINV